MYDPCWQYFASLDTNGEPTEEDGIEVVRVSDNDGMVVITVNPGSEQSVYLHLTPMQAYALFAGLKVTIPKAEGDAP